MVSLLLSANGGNQLSFLVYNSLVTRCGVFLCLQFTVKERMESYKDLARLQELILKYWYLKREVSRGEICLISCVWPSQTQHQLQRQACCEHMIKCLNGILPLQDSFDPSS